jgi:hypothetical protein
MVIVVARATPLAFNVPTPTNTPPSMNDTDPVAIEGVMVAVNVTVCPNTGAGGETPIVVVVAT